VNRRDLLKGLLVGPAIGLALPVHAKPFEFIPEPSSELLRFRAAMARVKAGQTQRFWNEYLPRVLAAEQCRQAEWLEEFYSPWMEALSQRG